MAGRPGKMLISNYVDAIELQEICSPSKLDHGGQAQIGALLFFEFSGNAPQAFRLAAYNGKSIK